MNREGDGAEWIFEGKNGSDYHVVRRWSPDYYDIHKPNNKFYKNYSQLCLYLFELSKLEIENIY